MVVYQGKSDFIAVCFDKADRDAAEMLIAKLGERRFRVWSNERGCNLTKKDDLTRFAECRTALILISKDMLESDSCAMLLRAAAQLDKALVLLFIDGTNLVGRDDLTALLSRSAYMIDFASADPSMDICLEDVLALECVCDCMMAEDEKPDLKKTGIWDILNREI